MQTPATNKHSGYQSEKKSASRPPTSYGKRTLAGRLQALAAARIEDSQTEEDLDHSYVSADDDDEDPWEDSGSHVEEIEEQVTYDKVYPTVAAHTEVSATSTATEVSGTFNSSTRPTPKQPLLQTAHKGQLTKRPDVPNGCFSVLFYGECKKQPKCTYSHDTAVLRATHAHYWKVLNDSQFKAAPTPAVPRSVHHLNAVTCSVSLLDTTMDNVIENTFLASFPGASLIKSVIKSGSVKGLTCNVAVKSVLFDTGALHASYISGAFLEEHRQQLRPNISKCSAFARLADGKTVVPITEVCHLELSILDSSNKPHARVVPLLVLPSCGTDIIIGLPQIIASFGPLFMNMIDCAITSATSSFQQSSLNTLDLSTDVSHLPTVPPPWDGTDSSDGPEEDAVELPTSFGWHLHYMEMPYEEALQEYRSLFDKQICPKFRAATDIVQLLETKGAQVFVPNNWNGVNGFEPITLQWKSGLPSRLKPPARPINPKLFENAKAEFERLKNYMYEKSTSRYASPLVIAPKPTAPFIRFCGDYVTMNGYIHLGNHPIPIVRHELNKIVLFQYFIDLDMVNSFHQFRLSQETSEFLSIVTPWGQYQPKFLPEGVSPASFELQAKVMELFKDFSDWTICIFDNFLILAHDYDDAYRKLEKFLDRCIERNLFLKFPKSFFGFDHANFFGYVCRHNSYELSQKRKDGINEIQFPRTLKLMQSFLGEALFFKSFVPNYSNLTAHLNEMTQKDFNWKDPSVWTRDYRLIFDTFKAALLQSVALHYPNYDWQWILRVDASDDACGAVLLQQRPTDGALLPINLSSKKFSSHAARWAIIEKEAFGCYFGVHSNDYFLRGKEFILETDHNNLVWIHSSEVPKIIRWRVFMQSFVFTIRHIKGSLNTLADYLSRMYSPSDAPSPLTGGEMDQSISVISPYLEILKQVHGGRVGHWGARETWLQLNKRFPGHKIPYRLIQEFVATCPICQKDRLRMVDYIEPRDRHLHQPHSRSLVGIDHLAVTPADEDGNKVLIVIVNMFDKFVDISPHKEYSAETAATAIFRHICDYGLIDGIVTDPGTAFTAEVVEHLVKWLGMSHTFSLVDVHTSNGVEATNREILRHLRALVYDERMISQWSKPTVLPIVKHLINSHISSETGNSPMKLRFGDKDSLYMRLPPDGSLPEKAGLFLESLNRNLETLRSISRDYQQRLLDAKGARQVAPEKQNMFQEGDFVLFSRGDGLHNEKLLPHFKGPYVVLSQHKNDVKCRDLIHGNVEDFHVERLKMFHGSEQDAREAAQLDNDQYELDRILAYRGDPEQRTTMEFEMKFADGTIKWLVWSKDLFATIAYENFCRSRPELSPLIYSAADALKLKQELNKKPITGVSPGQSAYVDIRYYSSEWYAQLGLPDPDHHSYVVKFDYTEWANKKHTKIWATCELLDEVHQVNHDFVVRYGSRLQLANFMTLVTREIVVQYPALIQQDRRERLLRVYQQDVIG